MFIDKKIRSKQRELDNYLSTYANDFIHQEMKEDFDKVLDNIESLANTFNFKMGIEIAIFNAILLHDGYLSITCKYSYKKGIVDIKALPDDKTLSYVLKIFLSSYCILY